ncbi:kinase-like domain-containing protein [Naematelia encephala]|uniref:Kinase-like domain-containing protein n=1 Tax=Naematelia encephala TaxID=71784 RepID=A0A1Y2B979_9TREE|nr:kinase-like domain-containing protein [Naematelia encephala]
MRPRWSVEPKIEDLLTVCGSRASISTYLNGSYNKCYKIEAESGPLLLRVGLPIDAPRKTESEVATMYYITQHTGIPIPRVLRYDATNHNVPHFPYISMEFIQGRCLEELWHELSMEVKELIVRQLARSEAEVFDLEFHFIGNLYFEPHSDSGHSKASSAKDATTSDGTFRARHPPHPRYSKFRPGPIVIADSPDLSSRLPRGPYDHGQDWLRDRVECCVFNFEQTLLKPDVSDEDLADIPSILTFARLLLEVIPKVFPKGDSPESTRIFHHDLHARNIIVDQDNIVGLLDWEFVSIVPVWQFCELPRVLHGPDDVSKPERAHYYPYGSDTVAEESYYWDEVMQYERVHLRKVFIKEMEQLRPSWVSEFRRGSLKRQVAMAINYIERGSIYASHEWAGRLVRGETESYPAE